VSTYWRRVRCVNLFSIRSHSLKCHQVGSIVVHIAATVVRCIATYRTEFTRYARFGSVWEKKFRFGSVWYIPNRNRSVYRIIRFGMAIPNPSIVQCSYQCFGVQCRARGVFGFSALCMRFFLFFPISCFSQLFLENMNITISVSSTQSHIISCTTF
jgi:hypothetical protein